jgi:hypothetical protein
MFTFDSESVDWEKYYTDMPEYNNVDLPPPEITVQFKFRNIEDYNTFMNVVTEQLYNGVRVFNGFQHKDEKTAWYPLPEKELSYRYV